MDNTTMCVLCFFELNEKEKKITCVNKNCLNKICVECLIHIINYSYQHVVLPCCPAVSCRESILISDVQNSGVSKEVIRTYATACFQFFLKSDGDSIQKNIIKQDMVDSIRRDKLQFLETSFPPAVALVARVAFKHKLHKILKHKQDLIDMKLKEQKKKCFLNTCIGFLDEHKEFGHKWYTCLLCENIFCKNCEKEIDLSMPESHICNEDDIQSLNIINGMTRCPGCWLSVFKDVGCDFITCSNCSTSFHYKTGEKTKHGSINLSIKLPPNQRLLSALYKKELNENCLKYLLIIESLRPVQVSKNIIFRPIHRALKCNPNIISDYNKMDLVHMLEKYTHYKCDSKFYINIMSKIEKRLLSGISGANGLEDYLQDSLTQLRLMLTIN